MFGYIYWLATLMLLQVAAEASHHHNHTQPVHIDDKIKDAISLVLQNDDSHSNPSTTTNDGVKTSPVKSVTEEYYSHPSNNEAKQKEIGDGKKKEVFGIWDEVPESGNFKVSDAVENLFLDQVNVRIEEFEDLKTQIAVLEQHLRKHADFAEFNDTEHMLVDLDEKAIKPYEEELAVMKKKIINSNHEMNKSSIEIINTMVDDAEKFLEINRERVNGVLDDHVASEEHKNEHDYGSHSPEHFADYVDLINDDETMVIIEEAAKELLIEYIDMDIGEFNENERQKLEYEKQIKEQFNLDNIEPDELQLRIAEAVLKDMNLKDMKSLEELLLSLRTQIVETNGKLNIDEIDQMAATLGEAETYLDNSNNKLRLVGVLEQEFQDFEKIESNFPPPKTTSDGVHFQTNTSTEVPLNVAGGSSTKKKVNDGDSPQLQQRMIGNQGAEEAANKVDGDYHQSLQEEEYPNEFLPFHFSLSLVILILIVVVVFGTAFRLCSRSQTNKSDSCEDGYTSKTHLLSKEDTKSPKLELVKEHEGWSSRKWASKPSRRKQM